MKQITYLTLIFISCIINHETFAQWEYAGENSFSDGPVNVAALSINQETGQPYVAYAEQIGDDVTFKVKKLDGESWLEIGDLSELSIGGSPYVNFKLNPVTQEPHVLLTSDDYMRLLKFDGAEWGQIGDSIRVAANGLRGGLDFHPETGQVYITMNLHSNDSTVVIPDHLFDIKGYPTICTFMEGNWEAVSIFFTIGPPTWDNHVLEVTSDGHFFFSADRGDADHTYIKINPDGELSYLEDLTIAEDVMTDAFTINNNAILYSEFDSTLYTFPHLKHFTPDHPLHESMGIASWQDDEWSDMEGGWKSDTTINRFSYTDFGDLTWNTLHNRPWMVYAIHEDPSDYWEDDPEITFHMAEWNGSEWIDIITPYNFGESELDFDFRFYNQDINPFDLFADGQIPYVIVREKVDNKISVIRNYDLLSIAPPPYDHSFQIYPNPSNGIVSITSPHLIKSLKVFSTSGEVVSSKFELAENAQIEIDTPGFYILQVTFKNGGTRSEKLIIR